MANDVENNPTTPPRRPGMRFWVISALLSIAVLYVSTQIGASKLAKIPTGTRVSGSGSARWEVPLLPVPLFGFRIPIVKTT